MTRELLAPPGSIISLESLVSCDFDIADNGRTETDLYDSLARDEILYLVTPEMRDKALLLEQSYTQEEIAKMHGLSEVAVWKGAVLMRERLQAGVSSRGIDEIRQVPAHNQVRGHVPAQGGTEEAVRQEPGCR